MSTIQSICSVRSQPVILINFDDVSDIFFLTGDVGNSRKKENISKRDVAKCVIQSNFALGLLR